VTLFHFSEEPLPFREAAGSVSDRAGGRTVAAPISAADGLDQAVEGD